MKKLAQYLAVFLIFFLCTLGGADVDDLKYLLIILGIAVAIIITIVILAAIDYRSHPYITAAQIIEGVNYREREKLIKSVRRSLRI